MIVEQILNEIHFEDVFQHRFFELVNKLNTYNFKSIALYGTGSHTERLLEFFSTQNFLIIGLIDQDPEKIGKDYYGLKTFSIDQIQNKIDAIIISSFVYQEEIYNRIKYLSENGIKIIKIYMPHDIEVKERIYIYDAPELGFRKNVYLDNSLKSHLNRYLWTSLAVKDKDILDIACGCGYGSKIMSEYAKSVTAVDVDEKTIEYAKKFFNDPKINYVVSSLENFTSKKKFDGVISFETIEHIADENMYILKIKELMKRDGFFVVSTPVANKNGKNDINDYHVNEFTEERFKCFLNEHFMNVEFFVQEMERDGLIGFRQAFDKELKEYVFSLIAYCRSPR